MPASDKKMVLDDLCVHYSNGNKPNYSNEISSRAIGILMGAAHGFGFNNFQEQIIGSPYITYFMTAGSVVLDAINTKISDFQFGRIAYLTETNPIARKDLEASLETYEDKSKIEQHIKDRDPIKGTKGAIGCLLRDGLNTGLYYGLSYFSIRQDIVMNWVEKIKDLI